MKIIFWRDAEHRELLKTLAAALTRSGATKVQHLFDDMMREYRFEPALTYGVVHAFITSKTLTNPSRQGLLGPLLAVTTNNLRRQSEHDPALGELHKQAFSLLTKWNAYLETHPEDRPPTHRQENPDIATFLAVAAYLHTHPDKFRLFTQHFMEGAKVSSDGHRIRSFLCYRYHAHGGRIVKAHLKVHDLAPQNPDACGFINRASYAADGKSNVRTSTGLIVPMNFATYLVGQVSDGAGLVSVSLPALLKDDPSTGLFMSLDEDHRPISGRILLVPTEIDEYEQAGIGTFEPDKLSEIEQGYVKKLANRIDFTFTRKVFWKNYVVTERKMVDEVERLLAPKGTPLFTYGGDVNDPFNPAATKHYTFNAALKVWDPSEDAH